MRRSRRLPTPLAGSDDARRQARWTFLAALDRRARRKALCSAETRRLYPNHSTAHERTQSIGRAGPL